MASKIRYEDVYQPLVDNTIIRIWVINEKIRVYGIRPIEGYKLHDKDKDIVNMDGSVELGYGEDEITCGIDYDFITNPRELYTVIKL